MSLIKIISKKIKLAVTNKITNVNASSKINIKIK